MLKRNLISAWRSLYFHRKQMILAILGLVIGLSSFLLIVQYVVYELSYDKFNVNLNNIFRVDQKKYVNGALTDYEASTGLLIAETLQKDYNEIADVTKLHKSYGSSSIRYKDIMFYEIDKCCFIEPSFFNVFSFPVIKGDVNDLVSPNAVFISESASKKYFGEKDPISEVIELSDFFGANNYFIKGVYKDMPSNSHFRYDFLFSNKNLRKHQMYEGERGWFWNNFYTYILLKPNVNINEFQKKLVAFEKNHLDAVLIKDNSHFEYILRPLNKIHLHSNLVNELMTNGNGTQVYLLLLIGIMILFISWSNYINSFTVRVFDRAKELIVKRIVGAINFDFAKQFVTEAFLVNIITVIITLIIIIFTYIKFNNIIGTYNILSIWYMPIFWIILFSVIIIGTIIFGLYPIILISTLDNTLMLKGKGARVRSKDFLRKLLVLFQFTCSIIMIIASFAIKNQISYMRNKDLGIDLSKKISVIVPGFFDIGNRAFAALPALKKEIQGFKDIENVSHTYNLPGLGYANRSFIRKASETENGNKISNYIWVDREYINLFKLKLLAGENLPEIPSNNYNSRVLLNESAVKLLGFNKIEDVIHEKITWLGGEAEVFGVINDYHHQSLKDKQEPIVLFEQNPLGRSYFCFEYKTNNYKDAISFIKERFTAYFPNTPFDYTFMDVTFNNQYLSEIRFGKIVNLFSIIVLFVSCIGLFSVTSHVMLRKYKEIAIRKVFGASSMKLYYLSIKEILITILISVFIALPVSYIWVENWLDNFASKVNISIWLFIIPVVIILFIVLLTVTFDTIKIVRKNPAEVLKEE